MEKEGEDKEEPYQDEEVSYTVSKANLQREQIDLCSELSSSFENSEEEEHRLNGLRGIEEAVNFLKNKLLEPIDEQSQAKFEESIGMFENYLEER